MRGQPSSGRARQSRRQARRSRRPAQRTSECGHWRSNSAPSRPIPLQPSATANCQSEALGDTIRPPRSSGLAQDCKWAHSLELLNRPAIAGLAIDDVYALELGFGTAIPGWSEVRLASRTVTLCGSHTLKPPAGHESFPLRFSWIAKRLETLRNDPAATDHNWNRRRDCGTMRLLGSEPSDGPAAHWPSNQPELLNGAVTHACR